MTQRRGTTTDRLSNVIQVIQLGRKSGILTVERGEGVALETGEVIFVHGQITHAHSRDFSGQQAIEWLLSWRACRFLFMPQASEKTTKPMAVLPSTDVNLQDTDPYLNSAMQAEPDPPWSWAAERAHKGSNPPQRTKPSELALQIIEKSGLTRSHRRLFLLVDGQRTIDEIARLTGRSEKDVQVMLQEMEWIGVLLQ
jgi:Domain of unknown function (DUF4388)